MVDVKELCEDGYRLAIQAVDLDKIGSGDAAAFFYIEAAEALLKALSYDPSLDVKDKASQYIRRAEELRALEQQGINQQEVNYAYLCRSYKGTQLFDSYQV